MQVESLSSSLEQERSKNKALKAELIKLQVINRVLTVVDMAARIRLTNHTHSSVAL